MARLKLKNIENVEGEYHLMFLEGKNIVEGAVTDMRYAVVSLFLFAVFVIGFVILSGFNLFLLGFLAVFLIFFLAMFIYIQVEKHRGKKQCIQAVQNSKSTDIVAKQVDKRKQGKLFVKSMSNSVDSYDVKKKYPNFVKRLRRRRKHSHLTEIITDFEKQEKKRTK